MISINFFGVELIDLGGRNYITRLALADALIRSGDLMPDGTLPVSSIIGISNGING